MSTRGVLCLIVGTVVVLVCFIGFVLWRIFALAEPTQASPNAITGFILVALLILVGLAAFIGIMNFLSFSAYWVGMGDRRQPFGLPEGTVRAILTIAFIVLVAVFASYLLTTTSARQPFAQAPIPIQTDLALQDAQALALRLAADGVVSLVPTKPGDSSKVDVFLRPRNDFRLADDVAKQVLTILSTILAAMIGFYFGARPADSAAAAPKDDERESLRTELNALLAQEQSTRGAIDTKLASLGEAKKEEVDKIKKELAEIDKKIEDAKKGIGDLTMPIDQVRTAQADAKAAVAGLKALGEQLEKIEP
jgi:hypothetical protein